MARACSICGDPRVLEIDAALLRKVAYRRVAEKFEASPSSIYRHAREHLPVLPAPGAKALPADDGILEAEEGPLTSTHSNAPMGFQSGRGANNLFGFMVSIQERTLAVIESASAAGRHETALKAIREARGNVDLLAKLLAQPPSVRNELDDLTDLSDDALDSLLRAVEARS